MDGGRMLVKGKQQLLFPGAKIGSGVLSGLLNGMRGIEHIGE
jgi:hypothetical protein